MKASSRLAWLSLLLVASAASACSCLPPGAVEVAFEDATTVVEAQFLGDRNVWGVHPEGQPTKLGIFQVRRVWRGDPPARLEVERGSPGNSCLRVLVVGERYVLADRGGRFRVGLCAPYVAQVDEVEAALGPGERIATEGSFTEP